jgi:long-subunit fatty acid transport protein
MGDVVAGLSRSFKLNDNGTFAKLTGKIKLPTADEDKRLGTGKTDYIAEASLTQSYGDAYATAKIGHKFIGDSSRYNFRDSSWRGSVGGGYKFTESTTVGTSYSFKQSSSKNGSNSSQIMLYADQKLSDNWSFQPYGIAGLNDSTADYALGLMLSYKY